MFSYSYITTRITLSNVGLKKALLQSFLIHFVRFLWQNYVLSGCQRYQFLKQIIMSWLLGRNRQQQPTEFSVPDGSDNPEGKTAGERGGDSQLTKAERKAMEAYRFDSSALERAADAAKTLERSSKCLTSYIFHHLLRTLHNSWHKLCVCNVCVCVSMYGCTD